MKSIFVLFSGKLVLRLIPVDDPGKDFAASKTPPPTVTSSKTTTTTAVRRRRSKWKPRTFEL